MLILLGNLIARLKKKYQYNQHIWLEFSLMLIFLGNFIARLKKKISA